MSPLLMARTPYKPQRGALFCEGAARPLGRGKGDRRREASAPGRAQTHVRFNARREVVERGQRNQVRPPGRTRRPSSRGRPPPDVEGPPAGRHNRKEGWKVPFLQDT